MHRRSNSTRAFVALAALSMFAVACQSSRDGYVTAPSTSDGPSMSKSQSNTNGAAGQMPAFYDGNKFIVNMKEMPGGASAALIAHNGSINNIYATNDLDDPQDFLPVIDAIQGDGFNPQWHQVLIHFNAGVTPHQFTSDEDVLAAAAGPNPTITLELTDEMYRCSVVGPK